MKDFWNKRYSEPDSAYGTEPNEFFKLFIDHHKPGTILLPAEGEGRNAVYAAKKKWTVDAFDFSEEARKKALALSVKENIKINYEIKTIEEFTASKQYDAVALIYIHLPAEIRTAFHEQIYKSLKPGGYLVFEAFAKEQLQYGSGGPSNAALLYDAPMICRDFHWLHIIKCEQKTHVLNEGLYHQGEAAILRLTGQKI